MSSQDYSPAPYPFYNENGAAETYPIPTAQRERYWLYFLLFALTLLTATVTGAAMQADFDHNRPYDLENSFPVYVEMWRNPAILLQGLPFSLTLLSILLAHEFGHYLAALYHRVDASLPYFMPSPFYLHPQPAPEFCQTPQVCWQPSNPRFQQHNFQIRELREHALAHQR